MKDKLCKNCKWCKWNDNFPELSNCLNPSVFSRSLVTGEQYNDAAYLARLSSDMSIIERNEFSRRMGGQVIKDMCGREGKYFEDKIDET
jgi:hypothetical protein